MTTASTFNTPDRVIRMAMFHARILQDGDDPTPEDYAKYGNILNDLINLNTIRGWKLWTQVDQSVTLTAAKGTYTFGPAGDVVMAKPDMVVIAYYQDVNGARRPLTPLSRQEFTELSNPSSQGALNSYFVDHQQTQMAITLWNVPDATAATGTFHPILKQAITNFTGITDTLNFPVEWYLCLQWQLADEIASGQPQSVQARCAAKRAFYENLLDDEDAEDTATTMNPVTGNASSFR